MLEYEEDYAVIDFFGPIKGVGWWDAEIWEGSSFRWSTGIASIKAGVLPKCSIKLNVYVQSFGDFHSSEQIEIAIDGESIAWSLLQRSGYSIIRFDFINDERRWRVIDFDIPTIRSMIDGRDLGIAVSKIELFFYSIKEDKSANREVYSETNSKKPRRPVGKTGNT